ncbi:MAG: diguanylate cyclase [Rubrivivax sp.]
MRHFLDLLFTTDAVQRLRLQQAALAMGVLAAAVLVMHWFVWTGVAPSVPVALWTALSLGGMVVFFVLIRSGWSRRLAEPSLTVPQMVYALACCVLAYMLLGPARGAVFPIVMVILMFGMFIATPRQMLGVSGFTVLLFGVAIALASWRRPAAYPPVIELGHFLMVATMVPVTALLAGRVARMRLRLRMRRDELAQALERIRQLATRDELTGLVNRRHMQEVMAQEHQRGIRSGQTFCLVKLDIDAFKAVNDAHGQAVGDAVLRALAQEALRQVRSCDFVARWSGEEFVVMLPDTRAALARAPMERLIERLAALRIVHGSDAVGVRLSGGLAEHHAGESVEQTLERAAAALDLAKAQGGGRIQAA